MQLKQLALVVLERRGKFYWMRGAVAVEFAMFLSPEVARQ
jgi:hypothetical protein